MSRLDEFPEAFRRFEKRVNVERIKSFDQLSLAFSRWAGKNWKGTSKQIEALKVEAERVGIPVPRPYKPRRPREEAPVFRFEDREKAWRFELVTVKGSPQIRYRDIKTGRFIRKPQD